jgi:Fe-S-cluster containining protein
MGNIQESIKKYTEGKYKILKDQNDTFNFGCKQCGQCCLDNHDIIVSPWDVIRMSEALNQPSTVLLDSVLNIHVGQTSHIPVATLKMIKIPNTSITCCPFLTFDPQNNIFKCAIQKDKPFNCAIYPLGRVNMIDKTTGQRTMEYFCQDITCCADKTQTITLKDWIAMYDLQGSEQATNDFTDFMIKAANIINLELLDDGTDVGCEYTKKEAIYNALTIAMYGAYVPHNTTDTVAEAKKLLDVGIMILEKAVAMEPALASLGGWAVFDQSQANINV